MHIMGNVIASLDRPNRRPERVDSFLFEGETYEEWFLANRTANRFFILNIAEVIRVINPQHTTFDREDFDKAQQMIAERDQVKWKDQYNFEYETSRTQLYPDKIHAAKRFGTAATIILAMEMVASHKGFNINVYDYLRIIPAHYFVDRLTPEKLAALEQFHDLMDADTKLETFGEQFIHKSFEETCLLKINQEFNMNIITELSKGGCVTKFIAEYILSFVNIHYPQPLHVGPVRAAGQQSTSSGLGRKNAVDNMRVPKNRLPSELPPLF